VLVLVDTEQVHDQLVNSQAGADARFLASAISRSDPLSRARAAESILSCTMPFYHRVCSPGELPFITASTYRRTPHFLLDRYRFVQRLDELRQKLE